MKEASPDTTGNQKQERALLRAVLWAGLVVLAAQAATRALLPDNYVRQSIEEQLRLVALLGSACLLCCAVAAWALGGRGVRVLGLALLLVAALSTFFTLLPAILGEAIRN